MLFLRSTLFFIMMVVTAIIVAPLAILTYPFKFSTRYKFISQWAKFNIWWLGVTCNLKYEVEGLENVPQETAIVYAKHQSAWETLALQTFLPPQTWVLKKTLLSVPFFGWGLAMLQPVAINRASGREALKQLVQQGTERLESGHWIVIFPEGTRMPPGKMRKFGFGGAKLAEKSGHVIVPVAHNAGDFWQRRQFAKHPGVIKVKIGQPILTQGRKASEINAEAEAWMLKAMAEITGKEEVLEDRKKAK